MGGGWVWDANNALGLAALAGMLYLTIPGGARRNVRAHQTLGYAVLAIVLLHALWFLLDDGVAREFITPNAPLYMWTGITGLVLLAVLVFLAEMPARQRVHDGFSAFRKWHQALATAAIAGSIHHIIASGFYFQTKFQAVLLIGLAIAVIFGRGIWTKARWSPHTTPAKFLVTCVIASAVFTGIRNLVL